MSLLDDINAAIGSVFSNTSLFFKDAILTRLSTAGGWNEGQGSAETYPRKVMVDTYNDHLRAIADIPGTDVKLMIVGSSLAVEPKKGDKVSVGGKIYTIKDRITTDPARAMWEAQASPATA